ncbi:hypothetical protein V2G26_018524 [Clonostachys chloroleuca]
MKPPKMMQAHHSSRSESRHSGEATLVASSITSITVKDRRDSHLRFASSKLGITSNPIQEAATDGHRAESLHETEELRATSPDVESQRPASLESSPLQFAKRESASTSELFYDLWFVANLNVFATVHPITEKNTLASFIGYFILLWTTWLVTTLFDARFGQDGILERIARAFHLAVMIGFAEAGVSFEKQNLVRAIFQSMSLFLMVSRLVLAAQYGLVLLHARHHPRSRNSLLVAIVLHLVPALIYLIIAVVPSTEPDKHLVLTWYVGGITEMTVHILHATFSQTLSFEGTHFNERLNLLTLIILGEGVIILAKNITKVVEYTYIKQISDHWSPALIGIITSAAAITYITFQLYFDWMHHHNQMSASNQAYWALVHLPFHIALVLLAEGGNQWVVWWRFMEAIHGAGAALETAARVGMKTLSTNTVVTSLRVTAQAMMWEYVGDPKKFESATKNLNTALESLEDIPDAFWASVHPSSDKESYETWAEAYLAITSTVMNTISDAFDISVAVEDEDDPSAYSLGAAELAATKKTLDRLQLIFSYLFASAGTVLALLMILHLLSKRKGWTSFNRFRTGSVFTIGLGLGLVAIISINSQLTLAFLMTPWQLPIITICFMAVLILTHLPHPPQISINRNSESFDPENIGNLEVQEETCGDDKSREPEQQQDQRQEESHHDRRTWMARATRHFHFQAGPVAPITEEGLSSRRYGIVSFTNLARV